MEGGESFEGCAKRETMEEAGIEIGNIRLLCVSNLKFNTGKHYVDFGILADWVSGEPQILEPDRCEEWRWFALDDLPPPAELFGAGVFYSDTYKSGKYPAFKDA